MFLDFSNKRHSKIKFMILFFQNKLTNPSLFSMYSFQVSIIKISLQTYNKSTYRGLLLNFKSFASFLHKISLIKCLIDRSFKICNNWNSFHNDTESNKSNLIKNAYLPFLINKVIKKYLNYKFSSNQNQLKDTSDVHYFQLPYINNMSRQVKNKLSKLCKEFCKDVKIFVKMLKLS